MVGNAGPSTARDVVVTDRWPAGFTQFLETLSSTTGRCVGVGGDFTCSLGDLAVGNVTTITVRYNNMQVCFSRKLLLASDGWLEV